MGRYTTGRSASERTLATPELNMDLAETDFVDLDDKATSVNAAAMNRVEIRKSVRRSRVAHISEYRGPVVKRGSSSTR